MGKGLRSSISKYAVYILIGFYLVGATVVVLHFSSRQTELIEAAARKEAERYAIAIEEFRTLYSSEVVDEAMNHGLEVTHDYKDKKGAIPLPATLSMMLGERIGAREGGHSMRLYSKYPFPWRATTGGLRDNFQEEAWNFLTRNPEEPFYRFQTFNGKPVLRFATADTMRQSCVSCHNTHPESPKTDWKEGDVRGILEVTTNLEPIIIESRQGMVGTILVMMFLGILGIAGLFLVVSVTKRLQAQRAEELKIANIALQKSEQKFRVLFENEREVVTKLKELDRLQNDFVSSVSHELRTPLTALSGFTILLRDKLSQLPMDQQKQLLDSSLRNILRLSQMVEQVLTFSSLKRGKTQLDFKEVNLDELIKDVITVAEGLSKLHQIRAQVTGQARPLQCDPERVEQCLLNLLGNAIKYSPAGGEVSLLVKWGQDEVAIEVKDTGIGIPPEDLEKIFDRYYRVTGSGREGFGGSGIGLSIVKNLAELHGGRIVVESINGEGSTFTLILPLVPPN